MPTGWKLLCDEPDCDATFQLFGLFGAIQLAANDAGWLCPAEGFARCPECVERHAERQAKRAHR